MKKITVFTTVLLTGVSLAAQPVFETTFSESVNICTLESAGEVYYSLDVVNRQCHIYRMDRSLYKTIPLTVPEGYFLADVRHVSEKLFNDDGLIELVYICSKYVPTTASYYYTHEAKLINENGNEMLNVPGAGFTQVIETETGGRKLLVYEYDYSLIPWRTFTHVYSLPEAPVKSGTAFVPESNPSRAFPNPAEDLMNIPVELPAGVSTGTLEVTGSDGRTVLRMPVSGSDQHVILPVSNLVPGTYLYRLTTGSRQLYAGKFQVGR